MSAKKTLNVYQRLNKARLELQNINPKKTGRNTYSKFTYHELGDFLPYINQLCDKYGLFTQMSIKPSLSTLEGTATEIADLKIINVDDPEDYTSFTSTTAEARVGKKKDGTGGADPIQNLGAKITYMRRYMLMTAFEMVESDMVDQARREVTDELSSKDISSINATTTIKELTTVCGGLKKTYKAELIKPYFDTRKEEILDKVVKVKKEK